MADGDPREPDDPIGTQGDVRRKPRPAAEPGDLAYGGKAAGGDVLHAYDAYPPPRRARAGRLAILLVAALLVGLAAIGVYTVVGWLT